MSSGSNNTFHDQPVNEGKGCNGRGVRMPSLRILSGSLLAVFLIIALGMTGGQVRQLGGRVTLLEEERGVFQRRLENFKEDNLRLLSRLRDYQDVLEIAQQSNIALSKRLVNRELAVEDLQDSINSILEEKYDTESRLHGEIASLEEIKRDLGAQGAALSEAVAAQRKEIKALEQSWRTVSVQLAQAGKANDRLVAGNDRLVVGNDRLVVENDRYRTMLFELEDKFVSVEENNRGLVDRFNHLQDRAVVLEAEKSELKAELRCWIDSEVRQPGIEDPFLLDFFEAENSLRDQEKSPASLDAANNTAVATAEGEPE
jgi:chromosome segregation ATPase